MLKKISPLLVLLLLIFTVWYLFYSSMPRNVEDVELPVTQFSTHRALEHVEQMAKAPHFVGSNNHSRVRNYVIDELQKMGLEVQTQHGYVLNKTGSLSFAQNVLARIRGAGDGKAVVLMSHYDSAVHSSYGASDAASGVATILEGIRAFLAENQSHDNDIILLFTDVEEIGLLGAQLFIKKHPWAEDAKLALNFESRGSGGNSFMLLETNRGNAELVENFAKANPSFPSTSSLYYSIYKMLPNDTDLTVLREEGEVNGFNFAFIDDHFDYHTANDTPDNLDRETLAHQGSYLMPLLNYFNNADLNNLDSEEDLIYFTVPPGELLTYPFSWIIPMLLIALILFIAVIIYGAFAKKLRVKTMIKGAVPYLISLIGASLVVFVIWQLCLLLYPQYGEMEHGFTYNGYFYISAFIFLSLAIAFFIYSKFVDKDAKADYFVFPLFFWLVISALVAFYLEGAAYFIVPVFFGCLQVWVMLRQRRPNLFLMFFLSLPALIILRPFLVTFAVALGLKILFLTASLTVLVFSLFLPVFLHFSRKKILAGLCFLVFSILFAIAHFKSDFSEDRQKPNSLVYLYDSDAERATWNTYDNIFDSWTTAFMGEDPSEAPVDVNFESKYSSGFAYTVPATIIKIAEPGIVYKRTGKDSVSNLNHYSIKIAPNRKVHRMELFVDRDVNFQNFTVNDQVADSVKLGSGTFHVFSKRWSNRLLIYHAANRDTLEIEFLLEGENVPDIMLYEASYDLLENEQLKVPQRDKNMIPRPFVLNDAVVVKKTIKFEEEVN